MKIINILLQVALLIMYIGFAIASPPPCAGDNGHIYGQQPCVYLPAKPGQTPNCAKSSPGSTFCEKVNDYPENLIKKLLKNYDLKDILADESKDDFGATKETTYSYPSPHGPASYSNHGQFNHHGNFYGPADSNHYYNNDFNYHHRGYYSSGSNYKSDGYHYPRPGHSTHSFFQAKPQPSTNYNYAEYYDRTKREVRAPFNSTDNNSLQRLDYNRFLNIVSLPRSKRQASTNREQLCEVRMNYINPQAAVNARTGNWMYIVNGVETATQLVRTETCVSSQCANLCQLPNGYNSRCEQKYVQKRLVTLDPRGEKLVTDTFWFPSCCVCTLSNS